MKFMQLAFLTSGAPVYLSFPHFYKADPKLLDAVDGLKPTEKLHETYFKIQPVSENFFLNFFILTINLIYISKINNRIKI